MLYLYSTATWVQTADYQASDISRLKLPKFDKTEGVHRAVVDISKKCHEAATKDQFARLDTLEEELDDPVSKVWQIPLKEMGAIRTALLELGFPSEDVGDEDEVD
jgi:hypothetical protein